MSSETFKNSDTKHEPEIKSIKLREIDYDSAIEPIRKVDKKSREYEKLKKAIKRDGQIHPITVRKLTDQEKEKANNAVYGIIDGHHRYQIALENNQESILAEIYVLAEDDKSSLTYKDIAMAYRLNETSIKMDSLQKGEVIYRLIEENDKSKGKGKEATKDDVAKIGEEVFGLKKSMTYAALRRYRVSVGIETIDKPRNADFNILKNSLDKVPKDKEELDNLNNQEEIQNSIKAITEVQQQLRLLKKQLENQKSPDSSDKTDKEDK